MTQRKTGKPGPSKPLRGYGSMKDDPLTKQISAAIEKRNEVIFENASLRARIHALETALEPFGDVPGEGNEDYPDNTNVTIVIGRTTYYSILLGDLRRARSVLSEKQS